MEPTEQHKYLTFLLGNEHYAVAIAKVREIVEYQKPTRVPNIPACIRGVINLRGAVVPVIDLLVKFGGTAAPPSKWTCLVVTELEIEGEPAVMAVVADAVKDVFELAPGEVLPPPPFGTGVRVDYLLGMGKIVKGFALILDLDRVLSASELLAAAQLQAPEAAPPDPAAAIPDAASAPPAAPEREERDP